MRFFQGKITANVYPLNPQSKANIMQEQKAAKNYVKNGRSSSNRNAGLIFLKE